VAIDFETADAGRDSACSVAVVRVEGEKIVDSFASLVRPPRTSTMATHIHGISEAAQRAAPPLRAVWPRLAPLLQGVDLIVAHNAAFDRSVLLASWASAGLTPPGLPWGCTVKMARRIWPKGGVVVDHTLPTLARLFGITLRHHQADSDAEACARLVLEARAQARGERQPPARALAAVPAPAPVPAPASPPVDEQLEAVLELVALGRDAYRLTNGVPSIDRVQASFADPWVRTLVGLAWLCEHLEADLQQAGRGEGVRVESRVEAFLSLLRMPHHAPVDFVQVVRARERAEARLRADWNQLTKEQRQDRQAEARELAEAVRAALGQLPDWMGGRS